MNNIISQLLEMVIITKQHRNRVHKLTSDLENVYKPDYDSKGKLIGVKTSKTGGYGSIVSSDGIILLKLKGTQFEMGYQHGYLLAQFIHKPCGNPPKNLIKFWSDYVTTEYVDSVLPGLGFLVKAVTAPYSEEACLADRIPDDVFRSLCGLQAGYKKGIEDRRARGENLPGQIIHLRTFIRGYIQPDLLNIFLNRTLGGEILITELLLKYTGLFWPDEPVAALGCSCVSFMPPKTEDKDLIFGCGFDYSPLAGLWEKHLTGLYFDPMPENTDGEYDNRGEKPQSYFSVTSAGMHTAGLMGVNESGVAFRVHNNFTGTTDSDFHMVGDPSKPHGQPVLNFGSQILRFARDITGDSRYLEGIIDSIREGISCHGGKDCATNSPASGWSFIVAQAKKDGDKISYKTVIRETNFEDFRINLVPFPLKPQNQNRFAIIEDLPEIKNGEPIQAIWQTNFYTNTILRRKDIFLRRTNQIDNINRFVSIGQNIRNKYDRGNFNWKDAADFLADNSDLFSGHRRLNVRTIASLSNVTSIIYSINPDATDNDSKIVIYLGLRDDKKTPISWGTYHQIKYSDFLKNEFDESYPPSTDYSPVKTDDPYYKAMKELYETYCYYTFTETDELHYEKVIEGVNKVKKILSDCGDEYLDPIVDYTLGRLYCDTGRYDKAFEHFELSIKNIKYVFDPHIQMLGRLYFVRTGFIINTDQSRVKALKALDEMNKDFYFDKFNLPDYMVNALEPFLQEAIDKVSGTVKLRYLVDERLEEARRQLNKAKFYWPEYIEKSIPFDGPETVPYSYISKEMMFELQMLKIRCREKGIKDWWNYVGKKF